MNLQTITQDADTFTTISRAELKRIRAENYAENCRIRHEMALLRDARSFTDAQVGITGFLSAIVIAVGMFAFGFNVGSEVKTTEIQAKHAVVMRSVYLHHSQTHSSCALPAEQHLGEPAPSRQLPTDPITGGRIDTIP